MSNQQPVGWRANVRGWLQTVEQRRQIYGLDLKTAAVQTQTAFPKNLIMVLVGQLFRGLAVWIVKSALLDAATGLGISVDAETLDLMANLGVTALTA
jgi:hypothetical protein